MPFLNNWSPDLGEIAVATRRTFSWILGDAVVVVVVVVAVVVVVSGSSSAAAVVSVDIVRHCSNNAEMQSEKRLSYRILEIKGTHSSVPPQSKGRSERTQVKMKRTDGLSGKNLCVIIIVSSIR